MRRLKKILRLAPAELSVLAQACVGIPIVRLALCFTSVARLQTIEARSRRSFTFSLSRVTVTPEQIARLVRLAGQHGICRATCLEQSLVLRHLLRRRGIDAQIVFGARKTGPETQAHAWVEVNGVPLNEDDSAHLDFARFEKLKTSKIS